MSEKILTRPLKMIGKVAIITGGSKGIGAGCGIN